MQLTSNAITLTDMFCGCGGSSEGASKVGGVEVKLALNHWRLAIDSHNTNHPDTSHDCADISETHPARYGRTTGLIASPECTNHSIAKGRRRKNLQQGDFFQQTMIDPGAVRSRATMWDVVRFAEQHRYEFIITENVVDVRDWELWTPWLQSMHALGYKHKCVYLNAMFAHGAGITGFAPQSRDRIYIVFWKKGNPAPDLEICPPAPCPRCASTVEAVQSFKPGGSHKARYKTQYVYVCAGCGSQVTPYYYAALNCLDLSLDMTRIGDREKLGMKALSPKTIARIEYGLRKFGLRPTLLDQRNASGGEAARIRSAEGDVLNTQSTGYSSYLFSPFLLNSSHSTCDHNAYVRGVGESVHTQTTQQSTSLVLPEHLYIQANRDHSPLHHVAAGAVHTQTTALQNILVGLPGGFIAPQYGTHNAAQLIDALPTTGTINKAALCIPPSALVTLRGGRSLDGLTDPIATQVAAGIQNWIVSAAPFLSPYHGQHQASQVTQASSTIPTGDSISLVETWRQPDVMECYYRMLQPHETKSAQGFPSQYVILGNKDEQQKQIGNANPPPTMELLVQRCVASLEGRGVAV